MHFTNRAINGQLQSHCTTLWNPTKAQISMKFSKHAWHVDPLDSFNHVWPSNRKGNWAAKEMLPNIEVELNRTNFELIFIEFFELVFTFRINQIVNYRIEQILNEFQFLKI